jgi:hypothetical protein
MVWSDFSGGTALLKDLLQLWRHKHWRLALIVAAIAVLTVALLGGFQRAGGTSAAKLPVSGAGKTIESEAFSVTPLCAWSSDVRPGQPGSMAGRQRYLILRANVVNRARDWVAMRAYLDSDVNWLPTGSGDPVRPERSQRADDATLGLTLGPGLPVLVDFVWELPVGAAPPARSTWGMFKRRHVARTYASGEEMWVQDGPGWKFALPVGSSCSGAAS